VIKVLHRTAHSLQGAAMVAMAVFGGPGWLTLAVSAAVGVWFLGTAALQRRPAELHHAAMAVAMAWMATMPATGCHSNTGPVAGAAAAYFLLAAAPFLTGPFRTTPRRTGATLGSLGHAAMSLAMAALLTVG
jgi:hypothetical protein